VTIETIIWCSDPNKRSTIDHDWADEARAAASVGMNLLLVDHDRLLLKETDRALGNRELHEDSTDCLYRGWMMPVSIYTRFHEALRLRGLRLVTTPAQYEFCHHLPVNYHTIRSVTPETTVIPKNMLFTGSGLNLQAITDAIAPFGDEPIIVKDYVKSQKHLWLEACFVPKASDLPQVSNLQEDWSFDAILHCGSSASIPRAACLSAMNIDCSGLLAKESQLQTIGIFQIMHMVPSISWMNMPQAFLVTFSVSTWQ